MAEKQKDVYRELSRPTDIDKRIERILNPQPMGPDKVEDGVNKPPSTDVANDVTIHFDAAAANAADKARREAEAERRRQVTQITTPDSTPTEEDVLILGPLMLVVNKSVGFERELQKDKNSVFVYVDDQRIRPSEAMLAIFNTLKGIQEKGGAK